MGLLLMGEEATTFSFFSCKGAVMERMISLSKDEDRPESSSMEI